MKKLYWNTATPINLYIVCGCFHTGMAELNKHNREHVAHQSLIHYLSFYRKLPTLLHSSALSI